MTAELILDARNATGESPVWSIAERALYWVDIPAKRLHRWSLADGKNQSWQASQMLACIAQAGNGSWIAGMENGWVAFTARKAARNRSIRSTKRGLPFRSAALTVKNQVAPGRYTRR